ncbi:MAG TPA: FAD-dependent oxidoreductase [Candidatus Dormibacteraeota bacterium]|nr:FAD-dependent oxidoreductase [Candidatus Dormibacteraeota bacterium]
MSTQVHGGLGDLRVREMRQRTIVVDHAQVHVNQERCAGCQECVIRCPTHALSIDPEKWVAEADDALCVGCRQCERVCPYSAITVTGPLVVAARSDALPLRPEPLAGNSQEIRRGFQGWSDALVEADRCLNCPDPTCMEGCPAHIDIAGFIAALRERDLGKAHDVLSQSSFLPGICSRVCDQSVQCEGACSWALAGGQAVSIGRLERFVTDHGPQSHVEQKSAEGAGLSVAVVGSGPAGVAAAWELLSASAQVSMVEKDEEAGGVLRWGIPSFTLPDSVVDPHFNALKAAGLKLRTGCELGKDITLGALLAQHDAVILAHGASLPLSIRVPGADLPGVEDATSFLNRAKPALKAGTRLEGVGPRVHVLVLGGGNTAMDVARTLRRFGAGVTAVEWMDERFARVRPDELVEARDEGVEVRFNTTVERLEGDGDGVRVAWLRRTVQRQGTQRPKVVSGPPEPLPVDRVIVALGYRVDGTVAASVVALPLPNIDQKGVIPDRRWIASGIPTGPASAVGTQALKREVGLAVAGSPVHAGWWSRLGQRRAEPRGRFRATWWARIWRRQAEVGFAAAPMPQAERVWVAGDALVGPSTVAGAMAQGRAAARAVLRTRPRRLVKGADRISA